MWREYLGPKAKIIGVDIDPECKALEADGFEIWIGDQGDPKFWEKFLKEHPRLVRCTHCSGQWELEFPGLSHVSGLGSTRGPGHQTCLLPCQTGAAVGPGEHLRVNSSRR